jgi:hypothetical protein
MAEENKIDPNKQQVFQDKATKKKIDLHLRDIKDEISESDIANVKTDVTPNSYETDMEAINEADALLKKKEEDSKKKDEDGNNSNDIETPWNILG